MATSTGSKRGAFLTFVLLACCSCGQQNSSQPAHTPTATFGHRQLEQMLADRPEMSGVLEQDDPSYQWIVSSLNGELTGRRIYWNADSPRAGQGSEHASQYHHYPAQIYVSGGREMTPIDKWAAFIYELFNLENTTEFRKLDEAAYEGKIDGHTYATGYVKLEFLALQKTNEYFSAHPLPSEGAGKDVWYEWTITDLGTFEEYAAQFPKATGPGNYKFFKDYYDSQIVPWISRQATAKVEIEDQLEPEAEYRSEN